MKLTKILEAEIKQVMADYWSSYLRGDLERWSLYLRDDYRNIGSTEEEIWNSKHEILEYSKAVIPQMVGTVEIRNRQVQIIPVEPYFMVHEFVDTFIKPGEEWVFYAKFRLSSLIQKTGAGWKVIHQHGSVPDSKAQEGESIGFEKITRENLELREAVKRRTVELEQKNHELEIETSLERVRTVAMAMQKPDDLLSICETLFDELKKLGFAELRNTMINIHDDEKGSFLNYDFSAYAGKTITNIFYDSNPLVQNHVRQIKSSRNAFAEMVVTGEELQEWREFRKGNGERDDPRLGNITSLYYYFYSVVKGDLGISNFEPVSEMQLAVLKRFSNVFDLAYKRYTDITNAEAQSKEAQIELALERVRARTMSMQKSGELAEVSSLLFQQMLSLGVNTYSSGFTIWDNETNELISWMCNADGSINPPFRMPIAGNEGHMFQYESWKKGEEFIIKDLAGEEMQNYFSYLRSFTLLDEAFNKSVAAGHPMPERQIHHLANFSHGNLMFITLEPSPEAHDIFKRFAKVFDQTYTRFLDLQKAEAQTRESQIQLAMERVRARTMAMQHSSELAETSFLMAQQVRTLGIRAWGCAFNIFDEDQESSTEWFSSEEGYLPTYKTPREGIFLRYYEAGQRGEKLYVEEITGEACTEHYRYLCTIPVLGDTLNKLAESGIAFPASQIDHVVYFKHGYLLFITYEPVPEAYDIFKRFAKVFEQTYTRFLDLQKAEEQAKEAKIENALEKVRSRSLAMHKSDELQEVVHTVFAKLNELEVELYTAIIFTFEEGSKDIVWWLANKVSQQYARMLVSYDDNPYLKDIFEAKEKGKDFFSATYSREEKNKLFRHLFEHTDFKNVPEKQKQFLLESELATMSVALSKNTGINITSYTKEAFSEKENEILKRFSKVFDQAYTRFLDLQKAEAQAREARIEAALEKIRGRSLGMHHSVEIKDVVSILFEKLKELDLVFDGGAAIHLFTEGSKNAVIWVASPDLSQPSCVNLPHDENAFENNPIILDVWNAKETGASIYNKFYSFEEKNRYFNYVFNYNDLLTIPESSREAILHADSYTASFIAKKNSMLGANSWSGQLLSDNDFEVLKRIANVFEQAYIRFLDLQKAEAQSREAQIELGLERVRARAMAMQKSDELRELIGTVFTELTKLDLVLDRCVILIYDLATKDSTWWMANSENPSDPIGLVVQYHEYPPYVTYLKAWEEKKLKWQYVLEGKIKKDWDDFLFTETGLKALPDFVIAGMKAPDKVYLNFSFNNFGSLTLATLDRLSDEHFNIMLRFANVFDLTYTRFNDLQKAEAQSREARIEASLERVRAKAMSMHSSEDLASTIGHFYLELELFSITPRRCGVGLLNKETRIAELSTMNTNEHGKSIEIIGKIKMEGHPVLEAVYENWLLKKEYHPVLRGNEIKEYYQLLKPQIAFPDYPNDTVQYGYFFFFPEGGVYAWTDKEMGEDELKIYRRFTSVLSLTYKRYKDLQQAEELAKQAAQDLINLKVEKKKTEDALAELKTTQFQLIQSEKMASLGELTAGIAHEIQNPLNFVNNFSEVNSELIDEMNAEFDKGAIDEARAIARDIRQNLEKINHHGKRADAIVKGMLQHSRNSSNVTKEPSDMNQLADEYLRLAYHGLRAKDNSFNATIKTDYDATIGNITIVPQDIGRVILNLITNAFYAVGEKKRLNPGTYQPTVSVSTKRVNDKVEIKVSDNGNGIPQKIVDKIFQPFFTTKPTGQGTGLGLSLAYDIVKGHDGELTLETEEGEGTTFVMQLPG